ncbi:MAG TPA: VOC family protein [Alphaproteobacteria bacterium]|nr:VOC family protein [Alphaproteobacteria bacterium]
MTGLLHHVSLGVADLGRSAAFYDRVLATLGVGRQFEAAGDHVAYGPGEDDFFVINVPLDGGRQAVANNGGPVCFRAPSREAVDAFHAAALAAGARDDGAPGFRPQYRPDYYAAFVFDPDGHKVEAVCYVQPD